LEAIVIERIKVDLSLSGFRGLGGRCALNCLSACSWCCVDDDGLLAGLETLVERRRGVLLRGVGAILLLISISLFRGSGVHFTCMQDCGASGNSLGKKSSFRAILAY
jgi:hypothetical protein